MKTTTMKTTTKFVPTGMSLILLAVVACLRAPSSEALMVGRRRIKCTTPVGGNENVDALMDAKATFPFGLGFVGMQAFLPSLGKCPVSAQIQPPWFSGGSEVGGGICPPEFYNLGASAPGLAILGAAVAWGTYINSNRLLVTKKGLGILPSGSDVGEFEEEVLFSDVEDWSINGIGLVVKSSEGSNFFPVYWDPKCLEAVLKERIP